MASVHNDLMDLVDVWLNDARGKPRGAKFQRLEVLGLHKQKIMRRLVAHPHLFRRVVKHLPAGLRLETTRNFKASRQLYELTPPVKRSSFKMPTSREDPPKKLLRAYAEGEDRYGVPWSLLAAVNLIESRMGRLNGPSSSGALGPMQFMPATWDAYGKGSPFDPRNAIIAAARYLAANGAPADLPNAVWHYNHSEHYVNAVLTYHRHMAAHPKIYYSYYFWQAFARTTKGDLQLTGPGNTYPY